MIVVKESSKKINTKEKRRRKKNDGPVRESNPGPLAP